MESEETPNTEAVGAHEFTQEELEEAWKNFANTLKDRPRLYNIFSSRLPKLKENHVVSLQLENPLQKEILVKVYNKILYSLKNELKNNNIKLETHISDEEEDKKDSNKLYTVEDKFNYLADKNQVLQKLKKDFDLDFDY